MWHVVVPLKGWGSSKSRLELPEPARRQVVQAMAADTLAALGGCPDVHSISVLVRDHDLAHSSVLQAVDVVVQPDSIASLDAALRWFAATDRARLGPLAVVVADLPALRPQSVSETLHRAERHRRAMVADRQGSGTTVLTALEALPLEPHFGASSAAAHEAAGVTVIASTPDVACDVDTLTDLAHARSLGLGPETAALLSDPAAAAWLG